jgi:hypothetical protein
VYQLHSPGGTCRASLCFRIESSRERGNFTLDIFFQLCSLYKACCSVAVVRVCLR